MTVNEQTWRGDWLSRIYERVQSLGFDSVTAFAEAKPTDTLLQLAAALGDDVAAIQLEGILFSEAEKSGRFDRFARGLLVRSIRQWMPAGWNSSEQFELARADAFASWAVTMRKFQDTPHIDGVWNVMRSLDVPDGWLPQGPNDPVIDRVLADVRFDAPDSK